MTRTLRSFILGLILCVSQGPVQAGIPEITELETSGRWSEAIEAWAALARENPSHRGIHSRWLLALEAGGRHDDLEKAATRLAARFPGWDEPVVMRAKNWVREGKLAEAFNLLADSESLEASAWKARILTLQGKTEEAHEAFNSIMRKYRSLAEPGPRDRLAAGWALRDMGDYKNAARTMESAYRDSLDYLPARLALARLFHEKYQSNLAKDELEEARKLSPEHPDLYLVAAEISVQNHNFMMARGALEKCESLAGASRMSELLWTHMDLVAEQWDRASTHLEALFRNNPGDADALALWSAQSYMTNDFQAFENRTRTLARQAGTAIKAYLATGDLLELAIRTEEAMEMYHKVTALDSTHAAAWSSLGLLSMRMGREAEARGYLEKAFALDQYNVRAYNQLELLDYMETFADYRYDTFTLRLLPESDSGLVTLMAEEMKRVRSDLISLFKWEPNNKTLIEVFPSHDWFSSRIAGLAWIDGIPGVCFGDVLAMDSPRYLAGHSNWKEILKHEFGHVMALDMTDRKVPFWFTEGLSVYLEDVPPALTWDQNLVAAAWDNELVSIDSLTIAFTRPKSRFQRLLAYHQASLIIRGIVEKNGWDVIPKMLRRFAKGQPLEDIVANELGMSWPEFQAFTMTAAQREAAAFPIWPRPDPSRSQRIAAGPTSPDRDRKELIALFTENRLEAGSNRAREVLEVNPEDVTAHGVLGLIFLARNAPEDARMHLESAVAGGGGDYPVWLGLGSARLSQKDTTGAREAFQEAEALYPKSSQSLVNLARLAQAQGDVEQAETYYRKALAVDDELSQVSLELARLAIDTGNPDLGDAALNYALGMLPLEPDVYALRGRVKLLRDDDREAYRLFRRARHLDLRNVECMVGMAAYYMKREDYEEALYFAKLALKYDPQRKEAKRILRAAEAEI